MKSVLPVTCLLAWCVASFCLLVPVMAQEPTEPAEPPPEKPAPKSTILGNFLPTEAERREEEARLKSLRLDGELRSRLENTVWNDLELRAGQPGQVWMFHPPVNHSGKPVRDWYLNDEVKLPRVGSWEVKNQEIQIFALNGSLIGRGKFFDNEITGKFVHPDRKTEFGRFRLKEETKRNYRVLPLKVIKPTLGK